MTRAAWAERKVERKLGGQYISLSPKLTAELLLAEHRRAVRAVKAEYDRSWKKEYVNEAYREGRLNAIADILAALQRGRE